MRKLLVILFVILVQCTLTFCQANQNNFPVLKGPYLGQKPPGLTPEIFAPGIVSTNGFEHSKIEFAKDGNTFYWAAQPEGSNNGDLSQKIWYVKKNKDEWNHPEILNLPQVGVRSATIYPISDEIFFIGSNDVNPADRHKMKYDLFRIDKSQNEIKNISHLFPMLTKCWSFCFAGNGNLYYDYKDEIYFAEYKNGKYETPVKMNSSINEEGASVHPFVSPDESFLIFCSFRRGGYGIADLFISFRDKRGNWSNAINMGPQINTKMLERFPSLSNDGKYLFFTRNKDEVSDFYWVDAKIIEELRPKE